MEAIREGQGIPGISTLGKEGMQVVPVDKHEQHPHHYVQMKQLYRLNVKPGRLLTILIAVTSYLGLLIVDGVLFFPTQRPGILPWARFGFSEFVALLFLAVGTLVWLYARDRLVARTLFGFCYFMMSIFAVQTMAASDVNDTSLISAFSHASSALSLTLLAILLLVFPYNLLLSTGRSRNTRLLLRGYLAVLLFSSILIVAYALLDFAYHGKFATWLHTLQDGYYVLALLGCLTTVGISYRRATSLRIRQQRRILMGGVILALCPFLVFTVVPLTLNSPFVVDSQISAVTLVLIPIGLGYSILRYQILVFDRYVQKAAAWLVGCTGLAVLGYLVLAVGSVLLSSHTVAFALAITTALVVLGPLVWRGAQRSTERLFFSEIAHYRRLIERPALLTRESLDVNRSARLITVAVIDILETEEACLFVLDESGRYRLYPPLIDDGQPDNTPRRLLLERLKQSENTLIAVHQADLKQDDEAERIYWLEVDQDRIHVLSSTSRPCYLSELNRQTPGAMARFIATTSPQGQYDPLVAPLHFQGKLLGMMILGERGEGQRYAGTDFEVIQLVIDRFSPVLEVARLHQQEQQQQERINRELRAAVERQQALDRLKDQFIMTASHELRTPLTAIHGYIELLAGYGETLSPERRAEFITKAERGCDELVLLIENIMDASRVQVDADSINLQQVHLVEAVRHVSEILEGVTRKQKRTIRIDIAAHIYVMADELRLRQVLLNLVGNALKYSPPDTRVDISCIWEHDRATIHIRDYGLGIAKEDQTRLFERFVRLDRDLNSPVRGAGLGLYISKRLVEAMGGQIWMQSAGSGEGSTFSFALTRVALGGQQEAKQETRQVVE